MDAFWKQIIWQQFGATIDMLENAMRACPDELWSDPSKRPEWIRNDVVGFWYLVFHTLFWLDFYLSESVEGFTPPAPFTLDEFDPAGLLPERPYTKDELQRYLERGRRKCRARIAG
ncbi:MAG TPA: DinB family protein, partial [Candidatus Eisenbacteria bacterium]|nr:DinB family protein [Candidatus Eisenbacteria bacterium]